MFEEGIQEFWAWWSDVGRASLLAAIEGQDSDIAEVLSDKVHELHLNLDWQLTPLDDGTFCLAISGGGSRMLRVLTETAMVWAPVDDDRFVYAAARIAQPLTPFEFGDTVIDPSLVRVATEVDEEYEQLDVTMYIPGAESYDDADLTELAMILLDTALGEDATERWIGIIDTVDQDPGHSMYLTDLPGAIAQYEPTVTRDEWVVFQKGPSPKEPVVVALNVAAKHIEHLTHGIHVEIRIALTEVTGLGMPSEAEAERLAAIEDAIVDALPDGVILVARETGLNLRILHFYGRNADHLEEALTPFEDHASHDIEFHLALDADWSMLAQLR
ncbi:MAG: DUF695 domain-containing protein [Acidimicrobiia bacterium]|nr:DUF695 domain-containing protein [Acidimicrobiia bacterium]